MHIDSPLDLTVVASATVAGVAFAGVALFWVTAALERWIDVAEPERMETVAGPASGPSTATRPEPG